MKSCKTTCPRMKNGAKQQETSLSNVDEDLPVCETTTIDEILQEQQTEDESDDEPDPEPIPMTSKAMEAMDIVKRYVCSFEVDDDVMTLLNKMECTILNLKQKKQSTIDMFFKPV